MINFRNRIWEILEPAKAKDIVSKIFDIFILILIFFNVVVVILESYNVILEQYRFFFYYFEIISIAVFTLEYLGRVWSCAEDERFSNPFIGRLKFIRSPLALIDFLAIVPFYLPFIGLDLRFIRLFRFIRIFRLAKSARYIKSMKLFGRVLISKKEELFIISFAMILMLVVASALMYFVESEAQPDKFPNIIAAMWWSIATLTTVGYGDIYPITDIGKILASFIAILGIGFFAMPTAVLGSGLIDELQKQQSSRDTTIICPHCSKEIELK